MAKKQRCTGVTTPSKFPPRSLYIAAFSFAITASFMTVMPAAALNGGTGVSTRNDSSVSIDSSLGTDGHDTEAAANAEATHDSETRLESSATETDSSQETDSQTSSNADISTSVEAILDSENDNSQQETGSETDSESESALSGQTSAPGVHTEGESRLGMDLFLRSNVLSMISEPAELEAGDVEVQTSDPDADNFQETFNFYVIRHGLDYEQAVYREPARLGGNNVELNGSTEGSFWLGVTGPDEAGNQHEVNHQGEVTIYLDTENGWKSLEAQFGGQGELQHVNGVEPTVSNEEEEDEE